MSEPSRRWAALLAAAIAVSTVVPVAVQHPTPGGAASQDPRVRELENEIGEASQEEQAAVESVLVIRARRERLDEKVAALDAQVATAASRKREAEERLAKVAARYVMYEAQIAQLQADLETAQAAFETSIASMYRGGGGGAAAYLSLWRSARSFRDLLAGDRYLQDLSKSRQHQVQRVFQLRDQTVAARDALKAEKAAATAARAEAANQEARIVALRDQQRPARDAARAEEANENAALQQVRARKGEFTSQLAEIQAESQRIANDLQERGEGGSRPSRLRMPAEGPISSPFGERVHPIFGDVRMHAGIDIGAGYGAAVHAAASGTVVSAGVQTGYGRAVVIDHGGGLATLYGHLSGIGVDAGQKVDVGQTIGAVGSTGNSTGPHLHFEVRINGTPVDPMGYL